MFHFFFSELRSQKEKNGTKKRICGRAMLSDSEQARKLKQNHAFAQTRISKTEMARLGFAKMLALNIELNNSVICCFVFKLSNHLKQIQHLSFVYVLVKTGCDKHNPCNSIYCVNLCYSSYVSLK